MSDIAMAPAPRASLSFSSAPRNHLVNVKAQLTAAIQGLVETVLESHLSTGTQRFKGERVKSKR